jgi:hypothetical protein
MSVPFENSLRELHVPGEALVDVERDVALRVGQRRPRQRHRASHVELAADLRGDALDGRRVEDAGEAERHVKRTRCRRSDPRLVQAAPELFFECRVLPDAGVASGTYVAAVPGV